MTGPAATDDDPGRAAILAAMDRLLDGAPQQSEGRLSVSQLAAEAGVKRWHLTHQHTDLKDLFPGTRPAISGRPGRQHPDGERPRRTEGQVRRAPAALLGPGKPAPALRNHDQRPEPGERGPSRPGRRLGQGRPANQTGASIVNCADLVLVDGYALSVTVHARNS